MKHPILSGSGLKIYTLVWVAAILTQGSILFFYYGFPAKIIVGDSLIYNLLFAAITPGFWYIVRFASLSKDDLALAGTHVVAAFLSILMWSSLSGYVLQLLFSDQPDYLQFQEDSYIWRLIVGVMYYSISVLIYYLIKYYQDMQKRANRELELQNMLKDSELRMLKSQINPHFIFNSLNSISALTVSKPDTAREMV
ncbi:MAG: hypothetical protein GY816_08210, partial [Cytophagales bacterium]|nr:hypothetical protein [Cytophagales bacterium]